MKDNRIILTRIQVAKLELTEENKKFSIAWNFIRGKITSAKYASIVFQDQEVLDRRGIGGFFTTQKFVNILYLSKNYYDTQRNVLKFESDHDVAIFLHECSHYIHFACNGGKYTQKDLPIIETLKLPKLPCDNITRYFVEREAWQMSLSMNRCFRLGLEAEINKTNAHNMLYVEKQVGLRKITKEEVTALEGTMTIGDFRYEKSNGSGKSTMTSSDQISE